MSQPIVATLTAEEPSLKRIAWAYGCVRKGTSEETQLETLLLRRAAAEVNEIASTWASLCTEALAENAALRARIVELEGLVEDERT